MTTQDLTSRLNSLSDAHKWTLHLITRLSKLPAQPAETSQNHDKPDTRLELGQEIHQTLKDQEEDFELLRQEADDLTRTGASASRRRDSEKDRERTALAAQVARLAEDLKLAHTQFRRAQLQAKHNAEAAKRKERELLFASVQEGSAPSSLGRRKGQEKLTPDQLELNASNDLTSGLKRLLQLGESEVAKSQFAVDTLEESSAALSRLSDSYSNLDTLLSSTRSVVSTLISSQKSDTWYLETTFYVLASTIAWLIFRRLIYGPAWWLVYLPTRTLLQLMLLIGQLFIGGFSTFVGAIGGASQSSALSQASERLSTSLIVQPSATGGIPRFPAGMSAPSIAVGAGGHGAKAQPSAQSSNSETGSLSEKVGKMVEESREGQQGTGKDSKNAEQGTVLRERNDDERPNPKKRMWEEKSTPQEQETRPRDEL